MIQGISLNKIMAIVVLLSLYIAGYVTFRLTHTEIWSHNGHPYVIFPDDKLLYYFFRPLTYLDGAVTGIGFHIGPHRN
jgi:hypothetical protein